MNGGCMTGDMFERLERLIASHGASKPVPQKVELRPYQKECLDAISANAGSGVMRQAFSLPTGAGKTVLFSRIPERMGSNGRWLFVAHREELLEQTVRALENVYGPNSAAIEQADRSAGGVRFVVASVATIGRGRGNRRLTALDPMEFDGIVFDECHHAAAKSYIHVYDHFKSNPRLLTIGCSATLNRTDGVGLSHMFDRIVYQKSIQDMILEGWLVPIHAFLVKTKVDLSRVRTHLGDFSQGDLSRVVDVQERNAAIVRAVLDHAPSSSGIVFSASVSHAVNLAVAMNAKGLPSRALYGDMDPDDRRAALESFRNGETKWLTNYGILTEGTDLPMAETLVMARPTKSQLLFTQMLGRGLRLHPGKSKCVVLDVVDVVHGHQVVTTPTLFGTLPSDFDSAGQDVMKVYKKFADAQKSSGIEISLPDMKSVDDIKVALQKIRLEDIRQVSHRGKYVWQYVNGQCFCCLTGSDNSKQTLRVSRKGSEFMVYSNDSFLGRHADMNSAIRAAEGAVAVKVPNALYSKSAGWRSEKASPNQILMLTKNRVKFDPRTITKGEASSLIDAMKIQKTLNSTFGSAPK